MRSILETPRNDSFADKNYNFHRYVCIIDRISTIFTKYISHFRRKTKKISTIRVEIFRTRKVERERKIGQKIVTTRAILP